MNENKNLFPLMKIFSSTIRHRVSILSLCIVFFFHGQLFAQSGTERPSIDVTTGFELMFNPGGLNESLPFWMHVNRDGRVDQNSANALNYIEATSKLFEDDIFDIETGASISTRINDDPLMFLDKAYLKIRFFDFKFLGGRFIDPLTEKENELSTGSFMYSRNATPIPKIAFATDGFVDIPGTQGIVRYNGLFGHGWFENDRFVRDAYLHEKYFYLSIKYAFFDAVAGIVHNVQWAGVSQGSRGELPSGWGTFKEVVFASGSSDPDAPGGEQSNAVGNSVAAYDFSLGLFFDKFDLRAYRLFYLEDKVSTQFRSPWDGVWGLSVKPKRASLVQNILWEHINTKKQDSFDYEPYGTASYYYNGIYKTGWTYGRRVIGNPLILTDGSDGSSGRPIYNNIIIAHHAGISGSLSSQLKYKLLYTFSRNYGIYPDQIIQSLPPSECNARPATVCAELRPLEELKKINHSFYFEVEGSTSRQPRLNYNAGMGFDYGELYSQNRFGIMLGIEYKLF